MPSSAADIHVVAGVFEPVFVWRCMLEPEASGFDFNKTHSARCHMKNNALFLGVVLAASTISALATDDVSYKSDVYPVLHDYCLNCHEPGGKGYEASGLDMSTYASLMKGTKFGAVIKPGDSFSSVLIQLVEGRAHPVIKMPFEINGGLSARKIGVLKRWVAQGAKDN